MNPDPDPVLAAIRDAGHRRKQADRDINSAAQMSLRHRCGRPGRDFGQEENLTH